MNVAGGIPVMLPTNRSDVDELLDRLDGVIITGGGDVDPDRYGQTRHEKTDETDAERDAFEQAIVHAAIGRDLPMLGICRGLQIFNVALGGTLLQDLDDLMANPQEHRQQKLNIHHEELFQTATLTPGEHPLRNLVRADKMEINSFHHQSIDSVADSLQVMARTDDGVIEAVYNPSMAFGLAVQWHPEMLAPYHAEHAALFSSLIQAAAAYRSRITNREVPEFV